MRRQRAGKATPRVIMNCVADVFSASNERVIEFAFPGGEGGLIRLAEVETGQGVQARVEIYRVDPHVRILAPGGVDVITTEDPRHVRRP